MWTILGILTAQSRDNLTCAGLDCFGAIRRILRRRLRELLLISRLQHEENTWEGRICAKLNVA